MQYDMMLPQEEEEENDISGRRSPLPLFLEIRQRARDHLKLKVIHSTPSSEMLTFFPKDKIFSGLPLLRKTKDLSCAISNFWWFDLMELTTFQLKGITLFRTVRRSAQGCGQKEGRQVRKQLVTD